MSDLFVSDDDDLAAEEERLKKEYDEKLQRLRQQRLQQEQLNSQHQQPPPQPIQQPTPKPPQQPAFMSPYQTLQTPSQQSLERIALQPTNSGDPRVRLGLHGRTSQESEAGYNTRLKAAFEALGIQHKPLFAPTEEMFDPARYPTEKQLKRARRSLKWQLNNKHRRKLNPSDIWYDPAYAARWNAERRARHENNEAIRRRTLTEVRAWQASTGRELEPSPPPSEDSGDELYPLDGPGVRGPASESHPLVPRNRYICWECRNAKVRCSFRENGIRPCEACMNKGLLASQCIEAKPGVPDPRSQTNQSIGRIPRGGRRYDDMGNVIYGTNFGRTQTTAPRGRSVALDFGRQARDMTTTNRPSGRTPQGARRYNETGNINDGFNYRKIAPRGRSASPAREIENRCRECVKRGLECDMGRPCRSCVATGEWYLCDAGVQDQDYGNTEEDEFEFAQQQQENLDTTPAPPTATPDTSSANQPAPIIPYLQSVEARVDFLTNLAATAAGTGSSPTLSSIPQANTSPGATSISEYADAASAPDPFEDSMFGSIGDILNDPVESFEGAGRSPPLPQQEVQNAATTWGQADQFKVPETTSTIFEDFDMDVPYELDFDPDEMMEMLAPNPSTNVTDLPAIVPREDQLLPWNVRAYGASWEPPGSSNTLKHVDVLSEYPDNEARPIQNSLENNGCNEVRYAFMPGNEGLRCSRRPGTRCEFLQTASYEFNWQGSDSHSSEEPYYTCLGCHQDQNQEARGWEVEAKAATKAFVCVGCSSALTSEEKTRLATCVCLDKLNNNWLCHYHRQKGYQQIVIASGMVGNWLVQVGSGIPMCPRCYLNVEDQSSNVYACKSCRTYVKEA